MQLHAQYYYQQLPPQERAAYHGMLTCLRELTPSARIPRLPMETLSTLFFQLRLDHPEIFYAVGFSCRAVPEAAFVEFWPEYRFEKKRIREHRQAIEARVTRLLRPLRSLPPAEQERAIHDFVVENVRYDKLEKPYSHEVIGPLTNGVGVCEGMAKTVKLLCDGLGLPCMIAVSDRDRANGERYLHAWNIVQLGGSAIIWTPRLTIPSVSTARAMTISISTIQRSSATTGRCCIRPRPARTAGSFTISCSTCPGRSRRRPRAGSIRRCARSSRGWCSTGAAAI